MKSKPKNSRLSFVCLKSDNGLQIVPYKLERSGRIKRMRLEVDNGRFVTLKMPMRQAEKQGLRFLEEHGPWICRTLADHADVLPLHKYLTRHRRLSLNGRWHKLEIGSHPAPADYELETGNGVVRLKVDTRKPVEPQVLVLLQRIARTFLPQRLQALARKADVRVHGVSVRDQRSRWGSCSETGAISLNWRLILIAPTLQDHVLLHELAHLRHFDHSADFHAFLNQLDPRSKQNARRLVTEADPIINLGRSGL